MEYLGLFFSTQAWNVFIVSLLGFAAQLENPPPDLEEHMDRLIRKAAYCPGKWCSPEGATRLKEAFGFAGEFKHFGTMGKAAMFRTMHFENPLERGLHTRSRCNELRSDYGATKFLIHSRSWAD